MKYRVWILVAALGVISGCEEEDESSVLPPPSETIVPPDPFVPPVPTPPRVPTHPPAPIVQEWPSYPGVWEQQDSGTSLDISAIAAIDENHAWVADAGGQCRRTEDGGATWLPIGVFPSHSHTPDSPTYVNELQFVDELHGWAFSNYILMSTSDGGETWTKRLEWLPWVKFSPGGTTWTYTPVFRAMAFISPTTGWVSTSQSTRHTANGGESWTSVELNGDDSFSCSAIQFIDAKVGWMAVGKKIYRTTDQGQTWNLVASPVQYSVTGLSAVNDTHAWVKGSLISDSYFIFGLSNGNAWKEQLSQKWPTLLKDFQFVDVANGWVVGTKIHHTADGGATWSVQSTSQTGFFEVAFVDANVGWIVGKGGVILKTETGGK